jgi:Fanconi-associated nuclease 1
MTKLLLRKSDTWHRLDSLKFEAEIGSTEALIQAINEICAVPGQVKVDPVDEHEQDAMEEREVIDLTFDDGDVYAAPSNALQSQVCQPPAPQMAPPVLSNIKTEDVSISLDAILSPANSIAGPSSIKLEDTSMDDAKPDTNHVHTFPELAVSLAEDESDMDLPALLECLRVDELRSIVKQMHVKAGSKVGRTLMQRPLHLILI